MPIAHARPCPSQKLYLGADHADLVPSRVRGRADSMAGIEGFCADWLPCSSRTYKSALASHRDGTRQRSDVVAVLGGEEAGVQAASRS
jgi:hypothetical protein